MKIVLQGSGITQQRSLSFEPHETINVDTLYGLLKLTPG
jgi:hypothetical protein